jgi:hypothetical protein
MLAKNFERFMKNNKFKKRFSDRLKKAPQTAELEEAEKKDPRGPNEENEDSQCYYSEPSDEEDMKVAYELQYIEFLKLREKYKQQVQELNSLRIEKTTMLIRINDLEERLFETQLQLERVTDEKLTHMLSIQKSPTNKTGLGYVAPPSDILSTSRTVFVRPTVPEPPLTVVDKGKDIISGDIPVTQKLPTIRQPPICHLCGLSGHVRPHCSLLKAQRSRKRFPNKQISTQNLWPSRRL